MKPDFASIIMDSVTTTWISTKPGHIYHFAIIADHLSKIACL